MKKLEFKSEELMSKAAAMIAQAQFDAWFQENIENAPTVCCDARRIDRVWEDEQDAIKGKFTLTAKLVNQEVRFRDEAP